jgi:TonB family protein
MKPSISIPILAVALILSSCALFGRRASEDGSTKSTQNVNEFIPAEVEPKFDQEELQSYLIYPEEARKNKIEGKVTIQIYIDKEGKIRKTRIVQSDNPLLAEAAINALTQTTFTPALQQGKPVGVWMTIPLTFSLN